MPRQNPDNPLSRALCQARQQRISRRQAMRTLLLGAGSAALVSTLRQSTASASEPGPPRRKPHITPTPQASFSGEIAMQHAAAQMQWVPRHPGTEGARLCGDYILQQLADLGWSAEEQPFTYRETNCRNLIGKRGSGPLLIIGAHYDTRRRADSDPTPENRTQPVPGANDGASGVAVLLELARVIQPEALGRTIWLTAFDAEDNGGLDGWQWIVGSQYMVDHLSETPQGMVLVDMIGDADLQIYYERSSTDALKENIWQVAADLGYPSFIAQNKHHIIDDHTPFLRAGIPAVDLIDFDYPYWHTVQDTLDKISAASLHAVGHTLQTWLLRDAPGLPAPTTSDTKIYLPLITSARDAVPGGVLG
jgi:hypothetical protein